MCIRDSLHLFPVREGRGQHVPAEQLLGHVGDELAVCRCRTQLPVYVVSHTVDDLDLSLQGVVRHRIDQIVLAQLKAEERRGRALADACLLYTSVLCGR